MTILRETPPTRCEVCHQADCFDPVQLICRRCEGLTELQPKNPSSGETLQSTLPGAWVSGAWLLIYTYFAINKLSTAGFDWMLVTELIAIWLFLTSVAVFLFLNKIRSLSDSTQRLFLSIGATLYTPGLMLIQFQKMKVTLDDPGGYLAWGIYWIGSVAAIIGTIWVWGSWLRRRVEKKDSLSAGS